jgi:hypothetical protein
MDLLSVLQRVSRLIPKEVFPNAPHLKIDATFAAI